MANPQRSWGRGCTRWYHSQSRLHRIWKNQTQSKTWIQDDDAQTKREIEREKYRGWAHQNISFRPLYALLLTMRPCKHQSNGWQCISWILLFQREFGTCHSDGHPFCINISLIYEYYLSQAPQVATWWHHHSADYYPNDLDMHIASLVYCMCSHIDTQIQE